MLKPVLLGAALLSTSAFAGEFIVKLKDGAQFTNKSVNVTSEFKVASGEFVVIDSSDKAVELLKTDSAVEYIEPNYTYHISNIKDADYGKQWGLKNTGRNSGSIFAPGKKGVDVNAEKAWTLTKGNRDVKIAVIDTGVDYNHEDLKGNIMVNEAELNGTAGVDDDGNGYVDDIYGYDFANNDNDPMDGHGHGTHCAGVIGATHNSIGIAGVMANVQILPIQFLTKKGSGTLEGAIKSIDYAVKRGVQIMSNSWGGRGQSKALEDAIALAEKAGVLFIAAAGNENSDNDRVATLPASIKLPNIVSVGAMDGKGKKASFSNFGATTVHVFAPGVNIYSTVANNSYKKMSGTSMACPHVAGVAGLILANEPNLTYSEIKAKLMQNTHSGDDLGRYSVSGYVDAYKSMK